MKLCVFTLSLSLTFASVAVAQPAGDPGVADPRRPFENPREKFLREQAALLGAPTDLPGAAERIRSEAGQPGTTPIAAAPNPMFAALDADQDGVITRIELRRASAALMAAFDADQDGRITLAEVTPTAGPLAVQATASAGATLQMAANTIRQYDRNRDGKLWDHEMPPQLLAMLQGADQNGDRAIDAGELAAAMAAAGQGRAGIAAGSAAPGAAAPPDPRTFVQYDRDGDGMLSEQEVPQHLMPMLQGADMNGDRRIDARELQALAERLSGAPAGGGAAGAGGGDAPGAP